jgi:branched-chain amino acid transport system permease protein
MVALHLFLTRTTTGATIVAMAQNREGASLVGIDLRKVSLITFAISGALAAIAAVLFAPINLISPGMGNLVILKAFVIIILGGMGSIPGAVIAGFALGVIEVFTVAQLGSSFRDVVSFAVLFLVLIARPRGLLGRAAAREA